MDCKALPLIVSSIIPSSALAIEPFSEIGKLDRALAQLTPRNFKACLIISAAFAGLAIGRPRGSHDLSKARFYLLTAGIILNLRHVYASSFYL
jgi:hypothetical protein